MNTEYAIVDLFAGPGGLAEGFASIRNKDDSRPFRIALSAEKEESAFETLRLRSFVRQFNGKAPAEYYNFLNGKVPEPDWSLLYPNEWKAACNETVRLELGSKKGIEEIDERLSEIARTYKGNVVLIGGPPCQAYSLVGRARNRGTKGYDPSKDHRHFLYKEYIRILKRLMPAAFVMENVKGLLSSSVNGERVFDRVLDDLARVGDGSYTLVPLAPRSKQAFFNSLGHPPASDFVVRAEDHGIPQSRHRVIVVGVRADIAAGLDHVQIADALLRQSEAPVTVRQILKGMPRLRSGLSDLNDSDEAWQSEVSRLMRNVSKVQTDLPDQERKQFRELAESLALRLARTARIAPRAGGSYVGVPPPCPPELIEWLVDHKIERFPNNETRGHMESDLRRYFFAALYGRITGASPKANSFPRELAPNHRNWKTGKFADRFRVQLWNTPGTTITSHISKDGHYFIHPDAAQCRSLTVREAARLQTFPDNYVFKGNRTQQFVQVGNAVPPFLARKIALCLRGLLLNAPTRRHKSGNYRGRNAGISEPALP
ncbi:DNA cytosine methyltransferase [Bradyrhizobium sp. CER78]|uniref:DNA cytosine methyltransferase n=1 Tax=Bradyrhizobium sp. CER78 TaxID=3039162 RepID=UPI002447C408|nr:DNA cytosine methyltransferase [Bradyrhizobium sp. CER78]MDH2382841.1 DNA cytosine methyltransferase [Bradyrhizobium sp. CER78]